MFGIFSKKKKYDLQWLGVDMHSHVLPGVDDGCKDMETSLLCVEGLQELGLKKFFVTPHIYSEIYPNTPADLQKSFLDWQTKTPTNWPSSSFNLAAEYMIDDQFVQAYSEQEPLTLPNRHILIEMSYLYERQDFLDQLFQVQIRDYKPILAHPERYTFYHQKPKQFSSIKNRGCKLQLNILSLAGYYGEPVRKMATQLVREGMIDYVGTDLHHARHLKAIREFLGEQDLQKLLGKCKILNSEWL